MRLKLTPGQAVYLHGWLSARRVLRWADILANPSLTFERMRSANLTAHSLHQLQPDVSAWTRYRRAQLEDCPAMEPWSAHPIKDFHADLADLIALRWTPELLVRMGVTYSDLVDIGLNPANMALFDFTLLAWAHIGLSREDVHRIPEPALARLFGMPRADVLRALR
jgi:hypothetical protein